MKKLILLFAFGSLFLMAKAQNGFRYQPFSIGAGIGITTVYAGTETPMNKAAFNLNVNYNISPFFSLGLEGQLGTLAGGLITDTFGKTFVNNYNAVLLHADLQAGELINYDRSSFLYGLKDFYFGTGIGVINNSISDIQLNIPNNGGMYSYYDISSSFLVPIRIGYDCKIYNGYDEPQIHIDFCYNINTVFGEGLDGYFSTYEAPVKFYSYFSVGIKYGFGGSNLYRKPLRY